MINMVFFESINKKKLTLNGSILLSAGIGILFVLLVFPVDFILGKSMYWDQIISDRASHLVGYLYYLNDDWHWPIFNVPALSTPEGASIIYTDSIPLMALIFKIINKYIISHSFNYFGFWIALCYVLNGITIVLVLHTLNIRTATAVVSATILALLTPVLLHRWYHAALNAHFLIIMGMYFYVRIKTHSYPKKVIFYNIILILIALLTHVYIFVMVFLVYMATIARATFCLKNLSKRGSFLVLILTLSILFSLFILLGYIDPEKVISSSGYGYFSLNLFGPFYSYNSGFLAKSWSLIEQVTQQKDTWPFFLHGGSPDGTGGQYYEGYAYLGAGLLFLIIMAPFYIKNIKSIFQHHWPIIVLVILSTIYALSNHIYAGKSLVFHADIPDVLSTVFNQLRASGRFFWIAIYALTIFSLVYVFRHFQKSIVLISIAMVLQAIDTAPLRQAINLSSQFPNYSGINKIAWHERLKGVDNVYIIPSYSCGDPGLRNSKTVLQMTIARRGAIPINSAYLARSFKDCNQEKELLRKKYNTDERNNYVFFADAMKLEYVTTFINDPNNICEKFNQGYVCF